LGPELEKWSEEVSNYRGFLEILDELVEINERICDLRPVSGINDEDELETLKKKLRKQFPMKHKKKPNK